MSQFAWQCFGRFLDQEATLSEFVIKGGQILEAGVLRAADLLVRDGVIAQIGTGLTASRVLDAEGAVLTPGFVDLHVHLREPGDEDAETIETGARAAALGGYTAVVAMPNTRPPLDDPILVRAVQAIGADAICEVISSGCITIGRDGVALAPMGEMHALGVRIFTDDGSCVMSAGLMRRALEYSLGLEGSVIAQHAEDDSMCSGGSMHEGEWSSRLGIPGRPGEAEAIIVARDIRLAALTGARIHFLHLSTAAAVDLVRRAKSDGLRVTCEVAPHHFTLTDEACAGFDPAFKVHPPLRSASDVAAVRAGLSDGTIDAIATDHAPHTPESKERPFEEAPPGMLGLETAAALTVTELVKGGVMSLAEAFAVLSSNPASIAGISDRHGAPLAEGRVANICVFDPDEEWIVDPLRQASKSRNTPYAGRTLTGRARHTILRGEAVVIDSAATR